MLFKPTLGLALSGGGARGGAHLGVLRVLEEVSYQPDVVVGTSIGGLVAAMIGSGWSLEQMEKLFFNFDLMRMLQFDRSGGGLISTVNPEEQLKEVFGDADLRDLSPKTALMTTDVRHGKRVLLEGGPLVKALLATMAIPGLFPPVEWEDYLLVDGTITDNVPTQAAYDLGAEHLVAVELGMMDVGAELAVVDAGTIGTQVQKAFYWLLKNSKRRVAFEVLMNTVTYSQAVMVQYHLTLFPPDILIAPEMPDLSGLQVTRLREAADAGEQAARQVQAEIESLKKRRIFRRRNVPDQWMALTRVGVGFEE